MYFKFTIFFFYLELNDFMKLVNIFAPCTSILKPTCPLMNVLDGNQTFEEEIQYELDFSYLKPFITYEICTSF